MLSWTLIEKLHGGKLTHVGASTGFFIGLVAITRGAGFVPIWATFFITYIKKRSGYDDALDPFVRHGIGGIWDGISTGFFTKASINSGAQWNGLVFGG